ncbi:MAG: pantoate--beta-alanine ligase [Saprospiraceae bacterium]
MIIFKRVLPMQHWIHARKIEGRRIGFIPTMGALHQGHLSLMARSLEECDITVVSIFVNPKQFNDPQDLLKYPRPVEEDLKLLLKANIDVLFFPEVDEIYPASQTAVKDFDPGIVGTVMEGKFRPGHFAGVAEVMHRLLVVVQPDRLYMGQKDFQQTAIVRKLIHDWHLKSQLIICPTLREENGLAMSSRNLRLSPHARKEAAIIYKTLTEAKRKFEKGEPIHQIKEEAMRTLLQKGFIPEYFSIVDAVTLADIELNEESQFVIACCAVKVEGVRLIDNIILKEKTSGLN